MMLRHAGSRENHVQLRRRTGHWIRGVMLRQLEGRQVGLYLAEIRHFLLHARLGSRAIVAVTVLVVWVVRSSHEGGCHVGDVRPSKVLLRLNGSGGSVFGRAGMGVEQGGQRLWLASLSHGGVSLHLDQRR